MVANPAVSRLPDGGRFVALDSLRGVAALMVALHHMPLVNHTHGTDIVRHSWLFVDFFFVLSGFVIAGAYGERLRSGFSVRRFMLLRLGRIYPLHLLVLALAVAEQMMKFALQGQSFELGDRSAVGLLLSALLLQWANWPGTMLWSPPSWSVGVEIWLYLAIALGWHWFGRHAWVLTLALSALALAFLATMPAETLPSTASMLLRGVAGFGLGVVCWQAWQGGLAARAALPREWATFAEVGVVVAVIGLLAVPDAAIQPPLAAGLFAVAVLVFASGRGMVSRLLCLAPFVWLGVLSYSIYLIHLPVFLNAARIIGWLGIDLTDRLWLGDGLALGLVAASLAAAWLTWRFVEWPAREWSRRRVAEFGAAREESAAPTI